MPDNSQVEIGIQIEPQFGFSYEDIRDLGKLAEDVGFNSLWCSDHLFLDANSENKDCLDPWIVLAGLAVETTILRLGTLVSCVSFRTPQMLARISAAVDAMSGGRVDFGLGAGWKQLEYEAYGIPFPSAKERVDRFEEALEIITRMWTEARPSYQGSYYQIENAFMSPKPTQSPHPPIWVAGAQPRVLGLASRFAQGLNVAGFPPVERYSEVLDGLRAACQKTGRDYDSIKKSHFTGVAIANDQAGVDALANDIAGERGVTVDELLANYRGVIGTPDQVTEYLRPFVDLGAEQFMLVFPYQREVESVQLVAKQVLPRLRN
ncbi:MAG: TIGR03560 family F420-dependent LLM class oxidoreductase [SAR202 cluster bacterium]|jgi:alkanesulfonate monooxygenase|nr:TIGR03560 family F420-dependent LLM class oxidoreductase [SAR202 cluster bacterium]MDP6514232.1 TIGR03560 family F420-dependent LLM class oxidoreductase [SAR202 cluster bacterium]MDP6713659.1 TIGR03560 family F420-dependent LLM class oxidoreductase [SAR202 cluster bacterium]